VTIGTWATLAIWAAAGPPVLPQHADVRYRVEIAGEAVGWSRLAVTCGAHECRATWQSMLRAPEEAGGAVVLRRIIVDTTPTGEARHVNAITVADGKPLQRQEGAGPVPASLAEVILAGAAEGERRCLQVREEESGRSGRACARRRGAWLEGEVLGEPIRFRGAPGAPPAEVVVPAQRARFVADPKAELPRQAPRLFGVTVASPADPASRVCGLAPDPKPPQAPPIVPRTFPRGASCRDQTARYLTLLDRAGLKGRHAVGVAFDGEALVWHEWAEVQVDGAWIPVDPSFKQAPARGPRFTVARFDDRDPSGRADAGRKVLACWGGGAVPPAK
jgi:hypothetical protein